MNSNIRANLSKPFPASKIKFRVGATTRNKDKGQAFAYIDSRLVSERLDEVVGPEGWENKLIPMFENGAIKGYLCELSIWFGERKVTRSDCGIVSPGFGNKNNNNNIATGASPDALKGAASDSLKRAAVHFGIGRYLYDIDSPWVPIRDGRYLIQNPTLPAWALPENERGTVYQQPQQMPQGVPAGYNQPQQMPQ